MNIQLTNRIKQNARSFSKGQRLIAKYIEEHYDKVAFMTASKLGATVGVSESTVVRFATEMILRLSGASAGDAGDDPQPHDERATP